MWSIQMVLVGSRSTQQGRGVKSGWSSGRCTWHSRWKQQCLPRLIHLSPYKTRFLKVWSRDHLPQNSPGLLGPSPFFPRGSARSLYFPRVSQHSPTHTHNWEPRLQVTVIRTRNDPPSASQHRLVKNGRRHPNGNSVSKDLFSTRKCVSLKWMNFLPGSLGGCLLAFVLGGLQWSLKGSFRHGFGGWAHWVVFQRDWSRDSLKWSLRLSHVAISVFLLHSKYARGLPWSVWWCHGFYSGYHQKTEEVTR